LTGKHSIMPGHPRAPRKHPSSGETVAYLGEHGLRIHQGGPHWDQGHAAVHVGAITPSEVTVPAQNTGLGPKKTSFFQDLGITTKLSRGTTDVLSDLRSDLRLIMTGDKVGAREATPLNVLLTSPLLLG
jgi:hypothetical protein